MSSLQCGYEGANEEADQPTSRPTDESTNDNIIIIIVIVGHRIRETRWDGCGNRRWFLFQFPVGSGRSTIYFLLEQSSSLAAIDLVDLLYSRSIFNRLTVAIMRRLHATRNFDRRIVGILSALYRKRHSSTRLCQRGRRSKLCYHSNLLLSTAFFSFSFSSFLVFFFFLLLDLKHPFTLTRSAFLAYCHQCLCPSAGGGG